MDQVRKVFVFEVFGDGGLDGLSVFRVHRKDLFVGRVGREAGDASLLTNLTAVSHFHFPPCFN